MKNKPCRAKKMLAIRFRQQTVLDLQEISKHEPDRNVSEIVREIVERGVERRKKELTSK